MKARAFTMQLQRSETEMPKWAIRKASNGYILEPWSGAPDDEKLLVFRSAMALSEHLATSGDWFVFYGPDTSPKESYSSSSSGVVFELVSDRMPLR